MRGPVGTIISLAFSRDGTLLAATGTTPRTAVWDVKTGKLVRLLRAGGPRGSSAVAFGLDGVTVALAGVDGNVRLYDLRTGVITGRMVSRGTLMDVDFSPDGKLIAAAGLAGDISVWKLARRELVAIMTNSGVAIYTLRFSPGSKLLASGDNSGNVISGMSRATRRSVDRWEATTLSWAASRSIRAGKHRDGQWRWQFPALGCGLSKLIGAPLPGAGAGGWGLLPDGKHVIAGFVSGTGVIWNVDPQPGQHAPAAWRTVTSAAMSGAHSGRQALQ